MKKILCLVLTMLFCLLNILVCLAGDIPEGLLSEDTAMVFYGEITEVKENNITVTVTENIKGMAEQGETYSYDEWIFTETPVVGEVYLCGYYDEYNPLSLWEIEREGTGSLDIIKSDNMSNRMEDYINNGDFANAQDELFTSNEALEHGDSISEIGSEEESSDVNTSPDNEVIITIISAVVLSIAVVIVAVVIIKANRKK